MIPILNRRLDAKILLLVFVGVSLCLTLRAILDYRQQSRVLAQAFEGSVIQIEATLQNGLVNALWNFSPEDAAPLIKTLIRTDVVRKIRVLDSENKVFSEITDPDWASEKPTNRHMHFRDIQVKKDGRVIGTAQVWLSSETMFQLKKENFQSSIFGTLITIGLILVATFLLLHLSLFRRIARLRRQFLRLENRNLDQPFIWSAGDEVNELGRSLELARLELQGAFQEVTRKNSELQAINENLEQLATKRSAQLSESSRLISLGEMAGGVAHEINNPLAIISGKAHQLCRAVNAIPPEMKVKALKDLKDIETTVERIAKIIRGLRSISRDGSHDEFETVSMKNLIEENMAFCNARFKNNGIEIKIRFLNDPLRLECRPVQIGQVLLNLLNNSFDAVCNLESKWIEITVKDSGDFIDLWVTDSGQGIPPHVEAKLMQPFFTTKPVGKGTGLGLSICNSIIEAHGGNLSIDKTRVNTSFQIRLPKAQQKVNLVDFRNSKRA